MSVDPALVRGAKLLVHEKDASITLEPPVWFMGKTRIQESTRVGAFTYFRGDNIIGSCASIGRHCSIAGGIRIGEAGHPLDWMGTAPFQYKANHWSWHPAADSVEAIDPEAGGRASFRGTPATIGNDVWIASNIVILRGVNVGDGAVIAAGAVVTQDVAPYSIIGGVPAKAIRKRFPDDVIAELLELAWWKYVPNDLSGIQFDDIAVALPQLRRRIESGIEPYSPATVTIDAPVKKPAAPQPSAPSTRERIARRIRRR
ncbi:hypothetical protein BH09ACT10_BH09ACT10_25550 [soil metagenome]